MTTLWFIAAASFVTTSPMASEPYVLEQEHWSGLSYLQQTADEAKVDLKVIDGALDLADIGPGDVLMWLFPQRPVDVGAMVRFVKDGGFLIVADDRGTSRPLFKSFGVDVLTEPITGHTTYFRGLSGFPVLSKRDGIDHFLYFNISQLVANHPVALRGGTPVFSFDGNRDQHLVVEVKAGRGRFLGIGDPSIFINDMIGRPELHGNKQFAANVMRRNCSETCRVMLLTPRARLSGVYAERGGPLGGLPHAFDDAAELVNTSLADLATELTQAPWPGLLVFMVVIAGVWIAVATLQHLSSTRTSDGMGPFIVAPAHVVSPLEQDARGMASVSAHADFNHLTETLFNHVEGLHGAGLTPELGASSPFDTEREQMARRALLRIRSEAASFQQSGEAPVIGHDRFLRIYDDVRVISRYASEQRRQNIGHRNDGKQPHASS